MYTVALIGRTNVGKSTLFNRLTGRAHAITSPLPGTTRDYLEGHVSWCKSEFTLLDTGGLDVALASEIEKNAVKQVELAVKMADLIIFVTDVTTDILPADRQIAKRLRQTGKPVVLAINKCDAPSKRKLAVSFHELGLEPAIPVSAITGSGTGDLLDAVTEQLSKIVIPSEAEGSPAHAGNATGIRRRSFVASAPQDDSIKLPPLNLTILGRPNVGKSSLLNAILGEERALVSSIPHTTRDTLDTHLVYKGQSITLIDTAGIRRKAPLQKHIRNEVDRLEKKSVERAVFAAQRADVIVLVLEAHFTLSHQDLALAQIAAESERSVILVINKWDLVKGKDAASIYAFNEYFQKHLPHLYFAPLIFVSAVTKQRVQEVLDTAIKAAKAWRQRLPAPELEYLIKKDVKLIQTHNRDKQIGHPAIKLYGLKQVDTAPPKFIIYTNRVRMPKAVPNIIEKKLRAKFDFTGTPIKMEAKSMKFNK